MKNSTGRAAAAALIALTSLAGAAMLTAESADPSARPAASSARPSASSAPTEQDLAQRAAAALTDWETLDREGKFVLSAAGGINDSNSSSGMKPDKALIIEAACAGDGSLDFVVSSGKTEERHRIVCTEKPRAKIFEFTLDGDSLFLDSDPEATAHGGLAYLARRPASE